MVDQWRINGILWNFRFSKHQKRRMAYRYFNRILFVNCFFMIDGGDVTFKNGGNIGIMDYYGNGMTGLSPPGNATV